MSNWREFLLVIGAIAAVAFATFMLAFGVVALVYWTCGLLGLSA
jgi:hypothetical protein